MQNTDNWYVYMLRCCDGSLYTGIATDVERRFAEHQSNSGAKYLRGRGPLALVLK
ncbi:MAG: GIY-YIG nuclease family protein, partial [Deltaproteobacteria bacterium]|nr:GIY-YIG nuclease family protein [Deltaproteobacteria bacterium]